LITKLVPEINLHIYRYADVDSEQADSFISYLSAEEHLKYSALSAQPARQYLIERGFLRKVLAQCTNTPAENLEFVKTDSGKPQLAELESDSESMVRFNLSHCDELFVCAVSTCGEIGVDVESSQRSNQFEKIADHYFSDDEKEFLKQQTELFEERFTQAWTIKEAIGKMRGTGVNKTFLRNTTQVHQGKIVPNVAWLAEPVVTRSFKCDKHFMSFAVSGEAMPAHQVLVSGWSEL